jgi:enediyne biosynthesis protein E5
MSTSRAGATPSAAEATRLERFARIDPRYLIAGLITIVLLAAQFRYQVVGGYDRLALALGTCLATEVALSLFARGRVVNVLSAYISGISLTLLTKPQGGALWPFALGAFLAIASKYVLQYRNTHIWNPTNFAICALLLAAPDRVSVLSHQWGNDLATNAVIWCFGLVIASRVKVVHITLTYVASFLLLGAARAALLGQPLIPEIAPVTGPMYQLFIFFMITDPRTVVSNRRWQMGVAVTIAIAETLIRFASDAQVPLPTAFGAAPALLALAIVGPIAKIIDLRVRQGTATPARDGGAGVAAGSTNVGSGSIPRSAGSASTT